MKAIKGIFETVFELTKAEFNALINRWKNEECSNCDRQLYIYLVPTTEKYLAIDNLSGEMFMEEFVILNDAYCWLYGLKEAEPLKEAEKHNFWW